jgi:hypothetical protein
MRALLVPADSNQVASVVDADIDLAWLQARVGGLIEAVRLDEVLTDAGRKLVEATCFVNEEGKLTMLPLNTRATDLCALAIGGWYRDVIVGDAVVLGQVDDDGADTPVPDVIVRLARRWGWLR